MWKKKDYQYFDCLLYLFCFQSREKKSLGELDLRSCLVCWIIVGWFFGFLISSFFLGGSAGRTFYFQDFRVIVVYFF